MGSRGRGGKWVGQAAEAHRLSVEGVHLPRGRGVGWAWCGMMWHEEAPRQQVQQQRGLAHLWSRGVGGEGVVGGGEVCACVCVCLGGDCQVRRGGRGEALTCGTERPWGWTGQLGGRRRRRRKHQPAPPRAATPAAAEAAKAAGVSTGTPGGRQGQQECSAEGAWVRKVGEPCGGGRQSKQMASLLIGAGWPIAGALPSDAQSSRPLLVATPVSFAWHLPAGHLQMPAQYAS